MIRNNDTPGVIGEVGTILGRHGINITTFALGRGLEGAVGVVSVDMRKDNDHAPMVTEEIRSVPAVRRVTLVNL